MTDLVFETSPLPPAETGRPRRRKDDFDVPLVEIAIPVYNEEDVLEASVRKLRSYLDESFPFEASIVIVDNASYDRTWEIATRLCNELPGVTTIHLDQKGKGRAVRTAWTASQSPVVAYMDADLSTHLDGLLPLVAPLLSGHSQVAIGTRIGRGARVLRGAKREFISRSYNLMLRGALHCRFSDAQCGFKAMRRDAVEPLVHLIEDDHWFFDTELLMQAERNGFRIHEVPVDWIDDPDSRVNIGGAVRDDLRGVWRLARRRFDRHPAPPAPTVSNPSSAFDYHGEVVRYAGVGIISTAVYLALFLGLKDPLGVFGANLVAAAATSVGNALAHISFTFKVKGTGQARDAVVIGACSFGICVALTTGALAATWAMGTRSASAEGLAVIAGILAASGVRFVLLRGWTFRRHTRELRTGGRGSGEHPPSWDTVQAA